MILHSSNEFKRAGMERLAQKIISLERERIEIRDQTPIKAKSLYQEIGAQIYQESKRPYFLSRLAPPLDKTPWMPLITEMCDVYPQFHRSARWLMEAVNLHLHSLLEKGQ